MRSVYAEGYDGTREGEGFRLREVGNRRFSFLAEDGGLGGKEIPLQVALRPAFQVGRSIDVPGGLRRRRTVATGGRCLVGVRGGEAASMKGLPIPAGAWEPGASRFTG